VLCAVMLITKGMLSQQFKGFMAQGSCRTIALWFYILVSDHNAIQIPNAKKLQIKAHIFWALWEWTMSPLLSFVQSSIFYSILLHIHVFCYQLVSFIHLCSSLLTSSSLVYNFLQLGQHVYLMATNPKQVNILVCRENY
jgi:hypothetical protein